MFYLPNKAKVQILVTGFVSKPSENCLSRQRFLAITGTAMLCNLVRKVDKVTFLLKSALPYKHPTNPLKEILAQMAAVLFLDACAAFSDIKQEQWI